MEIELCFSDRYYDVMGVNVKLEEKFCPPHHYEVAERAGEWTVKGERRTTLGLNMSVTLSTIGLI